MQSLEGRCSNRRRSRVFSLPCSHLIDSLTAESWRYGKDLVPAKSIWGCYRELTYIYTATTARGSLASKEPPPPPPPPSTFCSLKNGCGFVKSGRVLVEIEPPLVRVLNHAWWIGDWFQCTVLPYDKTGSNVQFSYSQ